MDQEAFEIYGSLVAFAGLLTLLIAVGIAAARRR
jgi:hypothetical protein